VIETAEFFRSCASVDRLCAATGSDTASDDIKDQYYTFIAWLQAG
jgi:hypothetical protein